MVESNGGLPQSYPNEKTYLDYLHVVQEAEKEEAMQLSHGHTADSTGKPNAMSFFPIEETEGNSAY